MDKRENGFYWADVVMISGPINREVVEFCDGEFLVTGVGDNCICSVENVSNERVTESKLCKGNCKCKKQ